MRPVDIWTGKRLAAAAMEGGGLRTSRCTFDWDMAGRCRSPVFREVFARPPGLEIVVSKNSPHPIRVRMHLRCRMCDECLRFRAREWRNRAAIEIAQSQRTWLWTLTLRPDENYRALAEGLRDADADARKDEWSLRVGVIQRWLTLALKRIRKNSGARIRYLAVYEAHKSGLPHVHVLLHERNSAVRKDTIQAEWPHGFTSCKLVKDVNSALYVTKYLSKAMLARVRASLRYGKDDLYHSASVIEISDFSTKSKEEKTPQEKGDDVVVDDPFSWSIRKGE